MVKPDKQEEHIVTNFFSFLLTTTLTISENGLHPLATLRLVEYLIDVAERKRLQIIYTTHSEFAIEPLPSEAIWAAVDGNIIQGKLDIMSLRSIKGKVDSKLIVYTEDEFAKDWVQTILRSAKEIATDAIEVFQMGGDGAAVKANIYHNQDPGSKVKSICILDGDSRQKEDDNNRIYRLPGEAPEQKIFGEICDIIDECSGILAVRCTLKFEEANRLRDVINDIKLSNYDHHLLYSQIGQRLGFINENVIRAAFISTWCEKYSGQVNEFLEPFIGMLPKNSR